MPSGSVTLLEASKHGSDMLKKGVVETLIQESPILEQLPMMSISGNALKHTVEDTLPDPEFRNVNEGYNRSWGTDTEHFWGTAILGGEVFVDNYLVRVRGNVRDVKAHQYSKFSKAMALTFDKYFFDGLGTAKDFKGANVLITEGFGQALSGTDGLGANGLQVVSSAANMNLFLNKLDEAHDLLRTGTADCILLNRTTRRMITRSAREAVSGTVLIDTGSDRFGRQVTQWNGIPLRIIGDDKSGSPILGFDETEGSSTDAASLYLVRYGEDFVTGLLGLGGHFEVRDFGETEALPGHLGRVEVYPGIAIFDKYSIVRMTGIRK